MSKSFAIAMYLAFIAGVVLFLANLDSVKFSRESKKTEKMRLERLISEAPQSPSASPTSLPIANRDAQADSLKYINQEQDRQAERCKNGYSDGCDKERATAEFKRATGRYTGQY